MRSSALALTVALAAVAGSARAGEVMGDLGLLYGRMESWDSAAIHSVVPRLQLDGFAQASGLFGGPDIGSYRARLQYNGRTTTYENDTKEDSKVLTYSGFLSLGDPTRAPVSLVASADRILNDSSVAGGDARITGSRLDTIYSTRLNLGGATRLPQLSVGGSLRDSVATGFGPRTTENTKLLDASLQHGPGAYDLKLDYEGRWNTGTFDVLDYTSHTLDLTGSAQLADGVDGFMAGRWYQRVPDTLAGNNPRYDENYLVTGLRTTGQGDRSRAQYAYHHLFFTSPVTGERERIRQTASAWREIVHSPSWESVWNLDASVNQERQGGFEDSAYGVVGTPLARWRNVSPAREYSLEAGPSIGVLKPVDGGALLATGAKWRGRAAWAGTVHYSVDYFGDWAQNTQATRGWLVNQSITGDVDSPIGTGHGRLALTVASSRVHGQLFGDSAARSVTINGTVAWRRTQLQLDAGLRDGTSAAISGVSGDGLFVPSSFDSHTQFAALSATIWLTRDLSAIGRSRYTRNSGPELPTQQEASVYGGLQYRIGQLTMSVEDTYTAGGPSSFDRRVNEVWIRASRSFGVRY